MSELHSDTPPLDLEDWEIVLHVYDGYPVFAFILAQHLDCLKTFIQSTREGRNRAIEALDRAIESLMPYTRFRDADRKIYLLAVGGTLVE